jgi:four helix bundle protein
MGFRFRDFPIYQELRNFIVEIYSLANNLPKQEQFELASQLRRATTSALLNLAEGSMKKSDAELSRYLLTSTGSLSEIVAILDICLDQKYISTSIHSQYLLQCESLVKKLFSFRKSLRTRL